jgi:hypothetical protein
MKPAKSYGFSGISRQKLLKFTKHNKCWMLELAVFCFIPLLYPAVLALGIWVKMPISLSIF